MQCFAVRVSASEAQLRKSGRCRTASFVVCATTRANGRSRSKRLRDAAPTTFGGIDSGAVEYLVGVGVRPVERAAALLLAAHEWAELQDTSVWLFPSEAEAPGAEIATDAALAALSRRCAVTFQTCRDTFRELASTGVRKKAMAQMLLSFPGTLALPKLELEARLDALVDVGIDEHLLPRLLEKRLSVLQPSVAELHSRGKWLTALGVVDLSATLVLAPGLVTEPTGDLEARVRELAQLGPDFHAPALGARIQKHPELLLPLTGGSLADRLAFWGQHVGALDKVGRLAAQQPAVLTASVSVLRRKAALANSMLQLPVERVPHEWFGQVNIDRTLIPRVTFLLRLGAAPEDVARGISRWVPAENVDQFLAAAAQLVPPAMESQCTLEVWREHAASNVEQAPAVE